MCGKCELASFETGRVLKKHVTALRKQIELVRGEDVEGIHDMRVASRRLRAALKEFAPYLRRKPLRVFEKRVRRITRLLGKARELDVTRGLLEQRKGGRLGFCSTGSKKSAHA